MKKLVLIVGETGCGKDTVARLLPYEKVVSYTTRPMRKGEENGREHWFISNEEMDELEKRNDLIAWTQTGIYRYCATMGSIKDDIAVYIINPNGVRWLKENHPEIPILVVGVALPPKEQFKRVLNRGDEVYDFVNRNNAERAEFKAFRNLCEFDILINNKVSEATANIIKSLIE